MPRSPGYDTYTRRWCNFCGHREEDHPWFSLAPNDPAKNACQLCTCEAFFIPGERGEKRLGEAVTVEEIDDFEWVRRALRRLNPQFHENDSSWPALNRIETQRDTLLAALREIADWRLPGESDVYECRRIARAAIARQALDTKDPESTGGDPAPALP